MTKQAQRLKEFIEDLGLAVDGFRVQCGIKSSSTLYLIINDGKRPSEKLLQKIIKRYPQLNKDWVETGVGEMYLDQFTKHNIASTGALEASRSSQFYSIEQSLMNHDFAISELTKMVQKALLKNHEDINRAFKTLSDLAQEILNFKDWAEDQETTRMKFFDEAKKTHLNLIKRLDGERRDWIDNNDQDRKNWLENKHDENRAWTTQKLKEHKDWTLKMEKEKMQHWTAKEKEKEGRNVQTVLAFKTEIIDLFDTNTTKAIKEIGQHSINSKR